MHSKIWIINFVFAVLISACWVGIWKFSHVKVNFISDIAATEKVESPPRLSKTAERNLQPDSEYDVIVQKNLFAPDRMADIQNQDTQPVAEELKISGEKIMLYGVVMMDGYESALINNPVKDSDGKDYRWVKVGDRIANLKVVQIQKDQIMLNDGISKYRISLFDQNKAKLADSASPVNEKPKIISAEGSAGPRQAKEAPKHIDTGKTAEPGKTTTSAPKERVKISDDGSEYEIINTPFGTIKRKKKN